MTNNSKDEDKASNSATPRTYPAMITGEYDELWGFIPTFLHASNPLSTIEQLDEGYVSGWRKFDGFTLNKDNLELSYPGDPPMLPRAVVKFKDDIIAIYDYAWVLVLMPSGEWEVCRMD